MQVTFDGDISVLLQLKFLSRSRTTYTVLVVYGDVLYVWKQAP